MKDKIINVGITMPQRELDEMKDETKVDLNGPAVLAMARRGMEEAKRKDATKRKER